MRTFAISDAMERPKVLRAAGLVCAVGLGGCAVAILSTIAFGVPRTFGWALGLMVLFLIAPSFIAELALRAYHPDQAKTRLWGYPTIWGTMGVVESFLYLLHKQHRDTHSAPQDSEA